MDLYFWPIFILKNFMCLVQYPFHGEGTGEPWNTTPDRMGYPLPQIGKGLTPPHPMGKQMDAPRHAGLSSCEGGGFSIEGREYHSSSPNEAT